MRHSNADSRFKGRPRWYQWYRDQKESLSTSLSFPRPRKRRVSRQKTTVVQRHPHTFIRVLFLLCPVAVTSTTLTMNWCNIFMKSGTANQTLALLQIAAKAHEILITLSLSEILVYYLRQRLMSKHGISLGLFSAAYSVGLGSLPFLRTFWHPFSWSMRPGKVNWHTRALIYLVLLISILGLTANPAASIALIPRLDWWPGPGVFLYIDKKGATTPLSQRGFSMFIPKDIFPVEVNSSSIYGDNRLVGKSSPEEIQWVDAWNDPRNWTNRYVSQYLQARGSEWDTAQLNSTLEESGGRYVASTGFGYGGDIGRDSYTFRTDTLISNSLISQYLNYSFRAAPPGTTNGSWTLSGHVPRSGVKVPRSTVWCNIEPAAVTQRNISLIYGYDKQSNPFLVKPIDISSIWNEATLRSPKEALFEWVNLPQIDMIAGFILLPEFESHAPAVTICTVEAVWSFTSMSSFPDGNVGGQGGALQIPPPCSHCSVSQMLQFCSITILITKKCVSITPYP